jgi:hypothetical protein
MQRKPINREEAAFVHWWALIHVRTPRSFGSARFITGAMRLLCVAQIA